MKDQLYERLIKSANQSKSKAKGIISNDTQYRLVYKKVLTLFDKYDMYKKSGNTSKLKKLEKEICSLSVEVLDYGRFRFSNG